MHESLAPEVARFIRANISSLAQLESLLWLRDRTDGTFSAAEIAQELRTSETSVLYRLSLLADKGVVRRVTHDRSVAFGYVRADPGLDSTLDLVQEAYTSRRHSVIALIFSQPLADFAEPRKK
jgi:hypothetical protein